MRICMHMITCISPEATFRGFKPCEDYQSVVVKQARYHTVSRIRVCIAYYLFTVWSNILTFQYIISSW